MLKRNTARVLVGAIAISALLAGCGGPDDPGHEKMPETGQSNQADIAFAQQMIPHHEQAIEMAKLVPSRAEDKAVIDLAKQIEQAQDPEIKTMTGWLKEWDAPAPSGEGHGGGHGEMPGLMTAEDMTKLERAEGAEFDRMWMEMMIEHHEGAIEMARTELKDGSDAEAKRLAQAIIDSQQAEIDTMKDLLDQG